VSSTIAQPVELAVDVSAALPFADESNAWGSTAITTKPRSVMCSAKLYPGWPGMCMSQYALL
jgi:hypothetical protein